jgi:hypothetical protein
MSEKNGIDLNKIKLQISNPPECQLNYETNSLDLLNYDSNNNELNKTDTYFSKNSSLSESIGTLPPSQFQSNKEKTYSKSLKKNDDAKVNQKSKLTSHSNSDLGYNKVFLPNDLYEASTPQENALKNSDTYQPSKSYSKKQLKQQSSFSLGSNTQKSSNWSKLKSR